MAAREANGCERSNNKQLRSEKKIFYRLCLLLITNFFNKRYFKTKKKNKTSNKKFHCLLYVKCLCIINDI